jgi:hypothetical protein
VKGIEELDAQKRIMPMNCISWNIGHLAWQEQQYFLIHGEGQLLLPEISRNFASGAPACTPSLKDMLAAWKKITQTADPWLDKLTSETLQLNVISRGKPIKYKYGNLLQRVIYHYWYHLGENTAIRQQLGNDHLPQFVGDIDEKAPYRTE